MSTRGSCKNLPRSPGQNLNFDATGVIAVREDEGRPPEFISQPFDLRVRYQHPGLVLFHIVISLADSVATKTTVYLQITANQIHSLKKSNHDTTDINSPNRPPFLENVRRQLNGVRMLTRLKFRLHDSQRVKFIVPRSFTTENVSEDPAFGAAESLAAASLFSLYLRHNILPRECFGAYQGVIRQPPDLANRVGATYDAMSHASRLYHGDGGKEHAPRDDRGPRSTRDRDSPSAPGTPTSCGSGSTLPFDDVPPYRAPPPPYGERMSESQSLRTRSDVADIAAAGLGGDCDLPKYGDTNRRADVQDPLPGVLSCGEEDGDIRSTTKRKRSPTVLRTTAKSAADAPRHEKLARTLFFSANDDSQAASLHATEQQQQPRVRGEYSEGLQNTVEQLRKTVRELQKEVEELQAWKKTHQKAFGDLEGTCCQLAERQDDFDDAVGSLSHDVDELGGKHDELGKQLLDVGDEVGDMMDDMKRTAQEEICENIDDSVAKKIEEIIESQVKKIKRKICEALQS
ncbi:hypothetical protein CGCFRS4_v015902 [Colletotrichum fructicola]|nr:hypothetical protein CGCFRS4_v015902 [Colletotrichum fructicola]